MFIAAMLVSALIITFIILVREEQYAFGRSPTQGVQQDPVDTTGESQVFPPSN